VWACRADAGGGAFGRPAADLDPDQLALASWTRLYDAALAAEDPPDPAALDDDDVFDGWLVCRRRAAQERSAADSAGGAAAAAEVYVVAPPGGFKPGQAAAIRKRSGPQGLAVQAAREKALRERGPLDEFQLPDVNAEVGMALNRLAASRR
jgi:hypothetical protein